MPLSDSPSPSSSENISEFLADREGLAGKTRERFRRLVHEYGGFQDSSSPRHSRTLAFVSLFLALLGLVLDRPEKWSDGVVWASYVFCAGGLIWGLNRDESKSRYSDLETDWEAYCLFLRPVILSDHPGLLDRNAKNSGQRQDSENSAPHSVPLLKGLIHARGPDFWCSGVLGLWAGMAGLVVTHLMVMGTGWIWSMAFPAAGVMLGLAGWILWRRLAYVVMKSDSRVVEP